MKTRTIALLWALLLGSLSLKAHTIPFQLIDKSIVFEATVDGTRGLFILDTGSSHLILDEQYVQGRPTEEKMRGITGREIDLGRISVNLTMGNLELKGTEALTLPLAHLSRRKGVPIMGLMGIQPLWNYELTIDFDRSVLELTTTDKKGNEDRFANKPDASFGFSWKGGIPVIEMGVGEKSVHFGFDTGATINVLDSRIAGELTGLLNAESEERSRLTGVAGGNQTVPVGQLQQVIIEKYRCPEINVAILPLAGLKGRVAKMKSLDGLLGYDFMRHFSTTINFKRRTIHLDHREGSTSLLIVARE